MSQDLRVVREIVGRLVRRERTLLGLEVGGQAALLAAVVLLVGLVAAAMGWDRGLAAAVVVVLAGVGAWAMVAYPLLSGWRRAGDRVRQARLVEGLTPELRGRLITAVERVDGPRGQESPALLALVARRAAELARAVRPSQVHPLRRARAMTVAAAATWVVVACAGLVLPQGLGGALAWWLAGGTADAAMATQTPEGDDTARVGDITLRYVYPEYTGLDPLEVPNTTGDAHGLPGTVVEVRARTGEVVEAAALVAYDEPPLEAQVAEGGREVEGAFTIQTEPGEWHLLLYHGGEAEPSEDFAIEVEPDLPPEVTLDADRAVYELAADAQLVMRWQARDDYGVREVDLEVDGSVVGVPLARPRGRRAEVTDVVFLRPVDLGLSPGDRASVRLAAWDNDTWSGTKAGRSATVELVVLGAKGLDDRNDERYREIRGALLDVLADHLEEPWPAGDTSGDMAAWGEELGGRYRRFDALVDNYERALRTDSLDARVVLSVSRAGRELIRYTQLTFRPGSTEILADQDYEVPAQLRQEAITTLENGILSLDRLVRNRALAEVARLARELEKTADAFKALLEDGDAETAEMLARLDQLERLLSDLARQAMALDEGALKEFANQRAQEMKNLVDEIRQAIAEGRMDEARELMSRLEELVRQLSEGVQDRVEARESAAEDMSNEAQAALDELEAVEAAQRELQAQLRQAQEQLGADDLQAADALWRKIEREAAALGRGSHELATELEESGRSFHEQQVAEAVASDADRLEDAVRNRDSRRSREKVDDVRHSLRMAENAILWMDEQRGRGRGPGVTEVAELQRRAREIARLLDQLEEMQGEVDPELASEMRQMAQEQEQLEQRLQQARRQAQKVASEMPIRPEGVNEALEEASQQMEDAEGGLRRARPMDAEGAQGAAAERIRDARESLRQAMEDMKSSSMPRPGQGQGGGRNQADGEDGREQQRLEQVEIPSPEEFMTPEAYRRALLEGMEGDVPAEYRALKKRYYEELVNQ